MVLGRSFLLTVIAIGMFALGGCADSGAAGQSGGKGGASGSGVGGSDAGGTGGQAGSGGAGGADGGQGAGSGGTAGASGAPGGGNTGSAGSGAGVGGANSGGSSGKGGSSGSGAAGQSGLSGKGGTGGSGGAAASGGGGGGGTGAKGGSSGSGAAGTGGSGGRGGSGGATGGSGGASGSGGGGAGGSSRYRVVVSSDFPPTNVCNIMGGCSCAANMCSDPDDVQSMVRFLLYANDFDVEALIASSGTFAGIARKQNILDMIALYDQVDENLRKHDSRYPTADTLRSITYQGRDGTWGKSANEVLGDAMDSDASNAIIALVDKPDPRPVWFSIWGGPREVGQAIWKVKATRSAADLKTFLSKMRVFAIATQDGSIGWMEDNFPDLFIIHSNAATYGGMFCSGGDTSLCDVSWLNANVRMGHGPLGSVYPPAGSAVTGVMEGDTPSYLHLVSANRGLNNPENPVQGGWGGQYSRVGSTNHWSDCCGGGTISKFRVDFQKDFAQRSNWMLP